MKKRVCTYVHNNRIFIAAFLIPSFIMLLIFALDRIYPFGDRSFLHIDMYHQYFPFLTDMYHSVRGKGAGSDGSGLLYSFNAGLGTNFVALYDYYLSSPLNLPAFLVPEKYLLEFFSYLSIVKIGLSGASFCYYLSSHFEIDVKKRLRPEDTVESGVRIMLLSFSLFYSMSGYMAAYNWDLMWLDVVALAPVVILGLEKLCDTDGRKWRLYVISLALSLYCNYYLCIMLCIYLVLYYLIVLLPNRIVILKKQKEAGALKERQAGLVARNVLTFAGASILSGGLAGIVLIPSAMSVKMTGFADSSFPGSYKQYFGIFSMLGRHLMDVEVETGLDHWPNIYASVAVFILFPLYVACRHVPVRTRICKLILAAIMFYSFSANIPAYLWHGFNYPDSLPARQSFLYILLILTMCFEAVIAIKEYGRYVILACVFLALGALTFIQRCVHDDSITERTIALSALVIVTYALLICIYRAVSLSHREYAAVGSAESYRRDESKKNSRLMLILYIVLFTVTAEAGINMKLTSVPTVSRSNYLKNFSDYKELYEKHNELTNMTQVSGGGLLYRFEREGRLTNNDAMLKAYPSISMFSSIGNGRINDFYKKYGMRSSKVFYCADGATPFIRALLGNKYIFVEDKDKELWEGMQLGAPDPEGVGLSEVADSGEVGLYAFKNSLPVGYMVYSSDVDVHNLTDKNGKAGVSISSDGLNPLERQNELASTLGASEDMYVFISEYIKETDADLNAPKIPGYYVAYCDTKRIEELEVTLPAGLRKYSKLKNPYIIDLGYLDKDETVHIDQGQSKGPAELRMKVYRLNTKVYNDLIEKLSSDVYRISDGDYGPGRISGQIEAKGDGYMILSIPYDEGFAAYVDGKKTEIYPAMEMMSAIRLKTGRHIVELRYIPPGLFAGLMISVLSAVIFVLFNKYFMD